MRASTLDTFGLSKLRFIISRMKDMRERYIEPCTTLFPARSDCSVKQLKMPRYLARINVDCAMDSSSSSSSFQRVVLRVERLPSERVGSSSTVPTSDATLMHGPQILSSLLILFSLSQVLAECIIPRPFSLSLHTHNTAIGKKRKTKKSEHPQQWPTIFYFCLFPHFFPSRNM